MFLSRLVWNFFREMGAPLGILIVLLVSFGNSGAANEFEVPRVQTELNFVKDQNQRSRNLLYGNIALAEKVKARDKELASKNASPRLSFVGQEYGIVKGSLVQYKLGTSDAEVLIDAATLPAGYVVADFRPSPDLTKIAFGMNFAGNDWQIWRIFDLSTRTLLSEEFKFKNTGLAEMSWSPDSAGLLYEGMLSFNEDIRGIRKNQVMYHALGTPIGSDLVIFENFEKLDSSRWNGKFADSENIIVYRDQGAAEIPLMSFLVKKTKAGVSSPVSLVPFKNYHGRFVGIHGNRIIYRSSQAGYNYGIVSVDIQTQKSKVIVSELAEETLYQAVLVGNNLLTQYTGRDLRVAFRVYSVDGTLLSEVRPSQHGMSDFGNPSLPLAKGDQTSITAYFAYSSMQDSPVTFRLDVASGIISKLANSSVVNFAGDKVHRSIVTVKSTDGFPVQMQLFSRNDLTWPAPFVYLYNYGYIGIPNLGQFNKKFQLVLDLGGIVAIGHVRGGGEFGLVHQLAGTTNRWTTFNDIVSLSRWIKLNLNVEKNRVVVSGRSWGGMTTMAMYVHFQDDFDLFTPVVPVSDVVKFIREESGWWAGDDFDIRRNLKGKVNPSDFDNLYKVVESWSPFQSIQKLNSAKPPKPLMSFSGDNDTRVGPQQATEFVRAIQDKYGQNAPVYMIEHEKAGHAARAEAVDEILFIMNQFGISDFEPLK